MKRIIFSLSTLVTACTSGLIGDEPLAPEAKLPLDTSSAEAQLPAELLAFPEERMQGRPVADPEAVDPVRASRSVRYVPARGVTVELDDAANAPADEMARGDMLVPGSRGLGTLRPMPASIRPRVVFGGDDRVPVGSSLEWPSRAIAKIYITWPNGQGGGCTGSLIGRKSVITAGHCIYNPDKGGWAASTLVVPGLDGTYMPFGSAYQVSYDTVTGWTSDQNNDYDYAMITLDRNLGDATGWFGIASLSDDTLDGFPSAIQGYPGDKANGVSQYRDFGPIETYDSTMLYYDIDTMPGDSGASVRGSGVYNEYVFGVHGGDGIYWLEHYNRAARINSSRFTKIQGWMANRAGLGTAGGDFTAWKAASGSTYTSPTAVSDGAGNVEVFVRGLDGAVYQKTGSGWTSRGGSITDSVAAVSRAPGQLDLFVRGTDGALWTKARNSSGVWWPAGAGWARLGGSITGAPSVVSYSASRIDVFARDVAGGVTWFRWTGTTWAAPESLGGAITDRPTAASWGPNRIDLFARGVGGNLVHKWWNGASWYTSWEDLGGWMAASPVALAPKGSVLEIFIRGGDSAVWHRRYEAGWKAWESLGGVIGDDVAAVSRTSGQIDLFVRGSDGGIYTKAHNGATWWPSVSDWAGLGGDMLSTPAVASTAWNRLDVYARGSDNGIRSRTWSGSAWSQ